MIGVIVLTHNGVGDGLLSALTHILGSRPARVHSIGFNGGDTGEDLRGRIVHAIHEADDGSGVLMLSDVYGASHTNIATTLIEPGRVEMIAGVNLPMLIRVVNYRGLAMGALIDKAIRGGIEGIFRPESRDNGDRNGA